MRILIVYGTTEGHTRHLCEFAADALQKAGREVALHDASQTAPSPDAFDAVILAGSLHVGRYQAALVHYAAEHHAALNGMRSAFLSVSLSAAGVDPHDWAGLEECLTKFEQETGWAPKAVHHAAGAIRYSQYDYFKKLALKYIAGQRGQKTVTSRDYDLTDYEALSAFVLGFAKT